MAQAKGFVFGRDFW